MNVCKVRITYRREQNFTHPIKTGFKTLATHNFAMTFLHGIQPRVSLV